MISESPKTGPGVALHGLDVRTVKEKKQQPRVFGFECEEETYALDSDGECWLRFLIKELLFTDSHNLLF